MATNYLMPKLAMGMNEGTVVDGWRPRPAG